jgi:hypothetical protein
LDPISSLKVLVFSRIFVGIPYSTEQGIILEEQEIFRAEQGNSSGGRRGAKLLCFRRGWSFEEAQVHVRLRPPASTQIAGDRTAMAYFRRQLPRELEFATDTIPGDIRPAIQRPLDLLWNAIGAEINPYRP